MRTTLESENKNGRVDEADDVVVVGYHSGFLKVGQEKFRRVFLKVIFKSYFDCVSLFHIVEF